MDITPPSTMQRFMIRVGLSKKRKVQRQSSLRRGRSSSRPKSGCGKGRPISTVTAEESVNSARDEGTPASRSTSKPVVSESDPSSLGARVTLPNSSSNVFVEKNLAGAPQPKRAKTFFGTLTNKLRVRTPAPRHTLDSILEPERVVGQGSLHRRTSRAQAVSITLPNDLASKERRAEALRARGLLPPRSQDLSAIEAGEDRRIDALQVNGLSVPGPDGERSDAKEIAQSWRSGNSIWLPLGPTTADAPANSVPEVIPPIDVSGDGMELSTEVDLPTSGPQDGPSSASDAHRSPGPSLQAASLVGSNDKQEVRSSRPASLRSSSEGLTGPALQSVPASPRSEENIPVRKPQIEIVGDADKLSSLSTPPLPASSEGSFLQQPPITEEPQVLLPRTASQPPVSPSRGSEDVPTPRSPRLPPSPRSVLSPRPAPSGPLPVPPDLSAPPKISVPAPSLFLHPSELDTLTASPTSPTVPSLFCSSSSEISHSTVFTDNGETLASPASYTMPVKGRRANLSPITVKSSEGGFLCEEIIIETTESFPEDDLDPFAGPQTPTPVNPKVDVSSANPPRRKSLAFLGMAKKRASTLDPSSPTAGISKTASMANLRRSMTSALQARTRPHSTLSPVDVPPQSPPPSPLNVTMHNGASILAQASLIDDDETRRLSELAFM